MKKEYPADKAGSLLIDAWTEKYNVEGGKGAIGLWALEQCKDRPIIEKLVRKAFMGSIVYTMKGEQHGKD
jgi:hypothetical protein